MHAVGLCEKKIMCRISRVLSSIFVETHGEAGLFRFGSGWVRGWMRSGLDVQTGATVVICS